jgi:hypothetical protein
MQHGRYLQIYTAKMEAESSSVMLMNIYHTTRRHIPEGSNFHNHLPVKLTCNMVPLSHHKLYLY